MVLDWSRQALKVGGDKNHSTEGEKIKSPTVKELEEVRLKTGKKAMLDLVLIRAMTEESLASEGCEGGRQAKARGWDRFVEFCNEDGVADPFMAELSAGEKASYLSVFAQAVRIGSWNKRQGDRVGEQNVSSHLLGVAEKFVNAGLRDPRVGGVGGEGRRAGSLFAQPLAKIKRKFKQEDPAVHHKTSLPVLVVTRGHERRRDEREERVADLVELGFTHLCRPGEYLKDPAQSEKEKQEASKLLRRKCFRFVDNNAEFPVLYDGDSEVVGSCAKEWGEEADKLELSLRSATHVEINFEDQKSGVKGVRTTSRANTKYRGLGIDVCAVRCAARIVVALVRQGGSKTAGINSMWSEKKKGGQLVKRHIKDKEVTEALRSTVERIGEEVLGIKKAEAVPHGLRAGGATAMMDAGATREQIEVCGRWAPGSGAVLSYLASTRRTDRPCFTELLSKWEMEQGKEDRSHVQGEGNKRRFDEEGWLIPSPTRREEDWLKHKATERTP